MCTGFSLRFSNIFQQCRKIFYSLGKQWFLHDVLGHFWLHFFYYLTLNSRMWVCMCQRQEHNTAHSWMKCGKRNAQMQSILSCCCCCCCCYYLFLISLLILSLVLAFYFGYTSNKCICLFNYFVNFHFEHSTDLVYVFWIDLRLWAASDATNGQPRTMVLHFPPHNHQKWINPLLMNVCMCSTRLECCFFLQNSRTS